MSLYIHKNGSATTVGGGMSHQDREKIEILERRISVLENTLATEKTAGLVKLSDSTTVTDSTGLALAASEKNAAVEGTIGEKLKSGMDEIDLLKTRFFYKSAFTGTLDVEMRKEIASHLLFINSTRGITGIYATGKYGNNPLIISTVISIPTITLSASGNTIRIESQDWCSLCVIGI